MQSVFIFPLPLPLPKRETFSQSSSQATQQHPTTPRLLFYCLPHSTPVHQGGGGAGGIHGLKEIIIDWCGGLAVDSVGQQHPGDRQAERDRDSPHWLSFSFSSTWHVYEASSFHVRLILSISGPSLSLPPLCLLCSKHMPLTVTICQSTRGKDKGAMTSSVSPAYFLRLIIRILAKKHLFHM